MDSDSYLNVEGNTNTVVALEKADKGKGKAIDPPEDLYEGPTLKVLYVPYFLPYCLLTCRSGALLAQAGGS